MIHGIKGAVGAIGISVLTDLCIKAEKVSATELDKFAAELIIHIEQEIENVQNWTEIHEQNI